jgi:hypothetical protein
MLGRQVVVEERHQVLHLTGVLLGPEGAGSGPEDPGRPLVAARRAADPEIDSTWVERLQHAELLGHLERAVVRQHHAARADPDAARHRGHLGDQHLGARPREAGGRVVLGQPVAVIAPAVRGPRQLEGLVDGVGRSAPAAHRRLIEDPDAHAAS